MRKSRVFMLLAAGLVLAVAAAVALAGGGSVGPQQAGASPPGLNSVQQRLLSGFASLELSGNTVSGAARPLKLGNYNPSPNKGCPTTLASNVKVNQNCLNISDRQPAGPRPSPERDRDRAAAGQFEQPRRRLQRLPSRRWHLRRLLQR